MQVKSVEVIVLELSSYADVEVIGTDCDLVLYKRAEDLIGKRLWICREAKFSRAIVGIHTVTQSPHKILPSTPDSVVLKVDIERVQAVSVGCIATVAAIEVSLERGFRTR